MYFYSLSLYNFSVLKRLSTQMEEDTVTEALTFIMVKSNMFNQSKLLPMEHQFPPFLLEITTITNHLQRNLPTVHSNPRMAHLNLPTKPRLPAMDHQVSPHMKPQNQAIVLLNLVIMPQNQVTMPQNQVIMPPNQVTMPPNQAIIPLFLVLRFMEI